MFCAKAVNATIFYKVPQKMQKASSKPVYSNLQIRSSCSFCTKTLKNSLLNQSKRNNFVPQTWLLHGNKFAASVLKRYRTILSISKIHSLYIKVNPERFFIHITIGV